MFSIKAILSITLVLFSIIDILGNVPVILSLREQGNKIEAGKTAVASGIIMIAFLFIGEALLSLFGVDIQSFALAGAIVIFIIGLEMILDARFFKSDPKMSSVSIFPLAFPLIAGAGALTTILTLKAEYSAANIAAGIIINLLIIYMVIKSSSWLQKLLGAQGVNVLRKIFGIVLLAISIKLFKSNLSLAIQ